MTKKFCQQYAKNFPDYNYIDEYYKSNDRVCKYIEESLSKDIGCADQKEGRRMIKEKCAKYMNESKGYPCPDAFCKGNECVYSYQEQTLSEDIVCDRKEAECMTKNNCKQYAKTFPSYTCINDDCKGNDCVYSSKEQQLCEDIGYEDKKEGRCMTTE